ncbi:hypothetical protein MLD38_020855 [Melastoma candidum]|uniref:Uncharacterized protein n=1 Tax=Melastoma candidum TaxID=119954 RepID=A0ACB9QG47_9MYRT|nr:hypothetical protein MLD38_020855 [Melastoma candidum]
MDVDVALALEGTVQVPQSPHNTQNPRAKQRHHRHGDLAGGMQGMQPVRKVHGGSVGIMEPAKGANQAEVPS